MKMTRVFNEIIVDMHNEELDTITLEINGEDHVRGFEKSISSLKEAYPQTRSVKIEATIATIEVNKNTWGEVVAEFNELNLCFANLTSKQLLERECSEKCQKI
jgi:hypothetical protein